MTRSRRYVISGAALLGAVTVLVFAWRGQARAVVLFPDAEPLAVSVIVGTSAEPIWRTDRVSLSLEPAEDAQVALGRVLDRTADAVLVSGSDLLTARGAGREVMSVALLVQPGTGAVHPDGLALVTSYALIEADPVLVRRITRAVVEGLNGALDDPDVAAQNAVAEGAAASESALAAWLRDHEGQMRSESLALGRAAPDVWRALMDSLRVDDRLSAAVHIQTVHTERFLPYPPRVTR